jgi:hypothetical protein
MIGLTDIFTLKSRLDKLKNHIDTENATPREKELAHKYLSKAIDYVNELQLYY